MTSKGKVPGLLDAFPNHWNFLLAIYRKFSKCTISIPVSKNSWDTNTKRCRNRQLESARHSPCSMGKVESCLKNSGIHTLYLSGSYVCSFARKLLKRAMLEEGGEGKTCPA